MSDNPESLSPQMNFAEMLAKESGLADLSIYQSRQIGLLLKEVERVGIPMTPDTSKSLAILLPNVRSVNYGSNRFGINDPEVSAAYQSSIVTIKKLLDVGGKPENQFDAWDILSRLEKYLSRNYTREEVLQTAQTLNPQLHRVGALFRQMGLTDLFIVGSFAQQLARPDSDVDLVVEEALEDNANTWMREKKRLETQLMSLDRSIIFVTPDAKSKLVEIFPRPFGFAENNNAQLVRYTPDIDLQNLVL